MDVSLKTCNIRTRRNINFSTYRPPILIPFPIVLPVRRTRSIEIFGCYLSHFRTSVSASSSSARRLSPRCFLADQRDGHHYGPSPCCRADVQEVPTVVLEFFPGLLWPRGFGHCHDEAVHLLPVGLEVLCDLYPGL
jgi:hypothetical protein